MKFDFSKLPVASRGYSEQPMLFLDAAPSSALTAIVELALIESGKRSAWESWQKAQLRNLLMHVAQRSGFWRDRMQMRTPDSELSALPILTRSDVQRQVSLEGSLLRPSDGFESGENSTSGSSGIPLRFFVSSMNGQYNALRALTYFFNEGKDLSLNYTSIAVAKPEKLKKVAGTPSGFVVEKKPSWLGGLGSIVTSGSCKMIEYLNPDTRALIKELRKDPVGYLATSPRLLETIVSRNGAKLLSDLKVRECILFSENADPAVIQAVRNRGIAVRSSYSCEEAGQIGFECETCEGHYHVTTSNVIVEVVDVSHDVGGTKLGRVLVTHLHSYATPFIRYDLGDLALLSDTCPCGHDGPTIHHLYGRAKNALKRRDGTLHPCFIRGIDLLEFVQFSEFRIRQVDFDRIVIEFGGCKDLSAEQAQNVVRFLQAWAGEEFKVEVIPRTEIDWGQSQKRQSFQCEI